jgi:diguanylate cyclase (GGDEF)-like protein/PAS domain S-box-containing protein
VPDERIQKAEEKILLLEDAFERISDYIRRYRGPGGENTPVPQKSLLHSENTAEELKNPNTLSCRLFVSMERKLLQADREFPVIFGYPAEEWCQRDILGLFPPHAQSFFTERWERLSRIGDDKIGLDQAPGKKDKEYFLNINALHRRGFEIPLTIRASLKEDPEFGRGFRALVTDISYRKELENELLASRENYRILAETASDGIIQIDYNFSILFANTAVNKAFGYEGTEIEGKEINILFPESRYQRYQRIFQRYFFIDDSHRADTGMQNTVEVLGKKKDGEMVPLEISFGNSMGMENNRILTCIIRDIAVRKKAERRLKYLAYHDKLTSLGNRDRLIESLDSVIAQVKRHQDRKAALLFMDLDGFKKVNDSLGHEMGDKILKECAQRLTNCLREEDQVYRVQMEDIFRLGGDEFTLLLPTVYKPEDAAVVAKRIIERILEPFNIEGYGSISDIRMGVSVGIALIPDDGEDRTTILRNADAAMYHAKELGNSYTFYTKEMNNLAMERLLLEEGLRKALEQNHFRLYYQPILNAKKKIIGLEALIRWFHPTKGLIKPETFIEIAEDTRLIIPIGRWVLEMACRQMKELESLGYGDFYIAMNISPRQLERGDLKRTVKTILQRVGLSPSRVHLELTEGCIMNDPESAIEIMEGIIKYNRGIKITVDDFGTGYSSLAYLSRFPVSDLKIDKTFVVNMNKEHNKMIINSIINLGKTLGLQVIAEGVENEEHLNYLAERECDGFQGYHFMKPMSYKDLVTMLNSQSSD